jgi:hypothetical protein
MKTFKLTISGNAIYKSVKTSDIKNFKSACASIGATFTEL